MSIPRTLAAVALAAAAAIALAGCSSSGSGSGAGEEAVATTSVDLPKSYRFDPVAITVKTGSTVTWKNSDNFTHSVQFKDGGLPSEPLLMQPGETTTFTFSTPGTFHYQCHLHPQNMQGSVVVTP